MSLLKTHTPEEKALLTKFHFAADTHSQLSDAFLIGLRTAEEPSRLKTLGARYESLMANGLICPSCGGSRCVGNPPDDYYDCPDCVTLGNKINSEAIISAAYATRKAMVEGGDKWLCSVDDLVAHANNVEQGKV